MSEIPLFTKTDWRIRLAEKRAFYEQISQQARSGVPSRELEKQMDEWYFRRPVPILGTDLAIRPFWRDNKIAPPLPFAPPRPWPRGHW